MSGSVNKVILIGNLGKDPESRTLQNGDTVVSFSIATSESWRDKQTGEKREKTEWHNVVIWNQGIAKVAEQYLRKGSKVFVEGQMRTRKWQDQQGQDRYTTEVVLAAFRGEMQLLGDSGSNRPPPASSADDYGRASGSASATPAYATGRSDLDDDIPF